MSITQTPNLGYEPIRAYIAERLKTLADPQAKVELQCIVTLCDGLEHQAKVLAIAMGESWAKEKAA